jgi:cyclohexanone monooxygenase
VGLRGKRVGIIGTGATSVQCVPHVGEWAEHLYVFQRTPSSIDVRANRPTDPEWARSLKPGWHQQRMDNFNILVTGGFQEEDLVSDGWTDIIRKLLVMVRQDDGAAVSRDGIAKTMELADFQKMEQIRGRVDSIVRDPRTAEALKPYYRQFCKRPCFHDEYLETFNRPNVTLIDTKGEGVQRVTPAGVVVDGVEYALDCLIYATGFEVGTDYSRRAGYPIIGRGGLSLTEKWAGGVATLHGMFSRGFPNCFIMGPQQTGFTVNFPHMLNEQSKHIAYILRHAVDCGVRTVEVSEAAEAEWVDTIIRLAVLAQDFLENCTPGYYNNEGKPGERSGQNGFYGGGSVEFFRILQEWRAAGDLKGLELVR